MTGDLTDEDLPLQTGCMRCGNRVAVLPDVALTDTKWRYDYERGWLCERCSQLNLGKRPKSGRPVKGNSPFGS